MLRRSLLLSVLIIILLAGTAAAALFRPYVFPDITVKFEDKALVAEKGTMKPLYCESKDDCIYNGCACFNKDADSSRYACSVNLSFKGCACMHNTCMPDVMSMFSGQLNIKKVQRQMMFKPECPQFDYFFLSDPADKKVSLLVLALKGRDKLEMFLDENCGSRLLNQRIDEALGGDFFDPCNGIDNTYNDCASFKQEEYARWLDSRKADVEGKRVECAASFDNCSFHDSVIGKIDRQKERCLKDENCSARCVLDCTSILLAKDACESANIDKVKFKEDAYLSIARMCRSRDSELHKAVRNMVDDEFAMDMLAQEVIGERLKEDVSAFNRGMFIEKLKLRMMVWLGMGAGEIDGSPAADIDAGIDELQVLSSETDDDALKAAIESQISELELLKESLR